MLCARSRGGYFPLVVLYLPSFLPSFPPLLPLSQLQPHAEGLPWGSLTQHPETPAPLIKALLLTLQFPSGFLCIHKSPSSSLGRGASVPLEPSEKQKVKSSLSHQGRSPSSWLRSPRHTQPQEAITDQSHQINRLEEERWLFLIGSARRNLCRSWGQGTVLDS